MIWIKMILSFIVGWNIGSIIEEAMTINNDSILRAAIFAAVFFIARICIQDE